MKKLKNYKIKKVRSEEFDMKGLGGRNRRLLYEWQKLERGLEGRADICWNVAAVNAEG